MANYPQELAQDAVCQSHTSHMTGLWSLPTRPVWLNTNERIGRPNITNVIEFILKRQQNLPLSIQMIKLL